MCCLLNHPSTAEDAHEQSSEELDREEVSLDFLEFLGGLVEADEEYITPMELYEYERLGTNQTASQAEEIEIDAKPKNEVQP